MTGKLQWLLDSSVTALVTAASITVGLLLIATVVITVARSRLRKAASTEGEADDFLLDLVRRTHLLLLLFPALLLGMGALDPPQKLEAAVSTLARLSFLAQGALWSAAIFDFFLHRSHRRHAQSDPAAVTTLRAFRFGALLAVWCVAVLVGMESLGINVTALVTGLGIGGVAVALATQNILGDVFASLSIVLDKPFVVGDFIRTGDDLGQVEQIGLKTTRVRALSGEQLVLSNSDLLRSRIRNYKRMDERRVLFRIGVIYQTTPAQLRRIPLLVRKIIENQPRTRFDRAHFAAFGDSWYDFEFVWFALTPDYNAYMDAQQAVNLAIVDAFAAEGIEFAYPTRTLLLQGGAAPDAVINPDSAKIDVASAARSAETMTL